MAQMLSRDIRSRKLQRYAGQKLMLLARAKPGEGRVGEKQGFTAVGAHAYPMDKVNGVDPALAQVVGVNSPYYIEHENYFPLAPSWNVSTGRAVPSYDPGDRLIADYVADEGAIRTFPPTRQGSTIPVRMAVSSQPRLTNPNLHSAEPAPGVWDDELMLQAARTATSGAPARAVNRKLTAIENTYNQHMKEDTLYHLAGDAIAQQLFLRARQQPLTPENLAILQEAASTIERMQQYMGTTFQPYPMQ